MKIAFAGKGGSGKTTLSSLFIRHLAARGLPVIAIDADINQHLAEALGADGQPPAMGAYLARIKEHLRGGNPRIPTAAAMVKTTPPGRGSRLLRPGGPDPVHALAMDTPCGALLMAAGSFSDDDLGVACYHSKTGAVELYLNHLADGPGEYVVTDCTAGADSFASGLFTRFDLTVLVAEPTRKGIGVYRQWRDYACRPQRRPGRGGQQGANPCGRGVPARARRAGPAGVDRLRARGPRHGTGPPARHGRSRAHDLRGAGRAAGRAGQAGQRLGQVRSPGCGVPSEERPAGRAAPGAELAAQVDPDFTLAPYAVPAAVS